MQTNVLKTSLLGCRLTARKLDDETAEVFTGSEAPCDQHFSARDCYEAAEWFRALGDDLNARESALRALAHQKSFDWKTP